MIDEGKLNHVRTLPVSSKTDFFNFFRLIVLDHIKSLIDERHELDENVAFGLTVSRLALLDITHPAPFSAKMISIGLGEKAIQLCAIALTRYRKMLALDANNVISKLAVHDQDTSMAIKAHYRKVIRSVTEAVFKDLNSIPGLSDERYYYSVFQAQDYQKHYKTLVENQDMLNCQIQEAQHNEIFDLKNKLNANKEALFMMRMERLEQYRYDSSLDDEIIDDVSFLSYRAEYCNLQAKILDKNNAEQVLINEWLTKRDNARQRIEVLRANEVTNKTTQNASRDKYSTAINNDEELSRSNSIEMANEEHLQAERDNWQHNDFGGPDELYQHE